MTRHSKSEHSGGASESDEEFKGGLSEDTNVEWTPRYPRVVSNLKPTGVKMVQNHQPSNSDREPIPRPLSFNSESAHMSQQLENIMGDLSQIAGFIAAAVVNAESGMALATRTADSSFLIDVAAAANTEVVRAKHEAMGALGLDDARIEDILITLTTQYHLIRPSANNPLLFIYLALDRKKSNLALARHSLASAESNLDL